MNVTITKYIAGYKVELSYTPTDKDSVETVEQALKLLDNLSISVDQTGLYLNPECRKWLNNIIEPIKDKVEYVIFDNYITIGLVDRDDISLCYSNKLPFIIPNTGNREWTLEELQLDKGEL